MIFVTGFGQMCNNILQFGHVYAWGREHDFPVIAMRFCYKYQFFSICKAKNYNWLTYLFAKYGAKLGLISKISFVSEEDIPAEHINRLRERRFFLLEGWYFRDYETFLNYREEIKSLFAFQSKIRKKVDKLLPDAKENILRLGVHVRRGDYKTWQDGNYYYSDEDYIRIIQSFCNLFPDNSIEAVIVSNEKKMPRELYQTSLPIKIHCMSGNPGEDLYALSTCDYLIGPPSTFSLMAAFYNDSNLYWILDKNRELKKESFSKFDCLFRQII